jgi:hypothetical protein
MGLEGRSRRVLVFGNEQSVVPGIMVCRVRVWRRLGHKTASMNW